MDRQNNVKESFEIAIDHAARVIMLFEKFSRTMSQVFGISGYTGSNNEDEDSAHLQEHENGNDNEENPEENTGEEEEAIIDGIDAEI